MPNPAAVSGEIRIEADEEISTQDIPVSARVELLLCCEVGDEVQLAELTHRVCETVVGRRNVARWTFEAALPRFGGVGLREVRTLIRAVPPTESVTLVGAVGPALVAIVESREHRTQLKSLKLRGDPTLRSIDTLSDCESLESVEISGANNVLPPWDQEGFRGFSSLRQLVLSSIPSLVEYRKWIAERSWSRTVPPVFIGAVGLPNGVDWIELGSHVRFQSGSFDHAKAHWLPFVPTYIEFSVAVRRGDTRFQLSEKCSAPELMAVLSQLGPIKELDCTGCEHLARWSPLDWLPSSIQQDQNDAEELRLSLPKLAILRGTGSEVDNACDDFVRQLEQLFGGREGRTTVEIEGEVAARLQAWRWILAARNSRVRLVLSSTGAVQTPIMDGYVEINVGQRSHMSFCSLLAQQGQDTRVPESIRVVGEISTAQIEVLRELLNALPKSRLHLAVQCHGGAEFALEEFYANFYPRVELSEALRDSLSQLNSEKEEYRRAAQWAFAGGAI